LGRLVFFFSGSNFSPDRGRSCWQPFCGTSCHLVIFTAILRLDFVIQRVTEASSGPVAPFSRFLEVSAFAPA
jgi:hypothetical protein